MNVLTVTVHQLSADEQVNLQSQEFCPLFQFSLGELVRLLSFESGEEAREFCAYYGLRAQGSDLVLDRAAYVEPETSIPSWRAISLVESKRLVSVGQVWQLEFPLGIFDKNFFFCFCIPSFISGVHCM